MNAPQESRSRSGRSFIRWAGSKRRLLPQLSLYVPRDSTRYVEPFAGSACLFFHVAPSRALLGDINGELITLYREVKFRLPELLNALEEMRKGKRNYLRIRSLDPMSLTLSERAARTIYLNRYCFNGIYRTNRLGQFNVPYGASKSGDLPTPEFLRECSGRLKKAKLVVGDFSRVLSQVQKGDFVYMDPPYHVDARRIFKEYDKSDFGRSDIVRLRLWLEKLDRMGIPFLVSYAVSEEATILAKGFKSTTITVGRCIAGFASKRRTAEEMLISNFRPKNRSGKERIRITRVT